MIHDKGYQLNNVTLIASRELSIVLADNGTPYYRNQLRVGSATRYEREAVAVAWLDTSEGRCMVASAPPCATATLQELNWQFYSEARDIVERAVWLQEACKKYMPSLFYQLSIEVRDAFERTHQSIR